MAKIFISHSSKDKELVDEFYQFLLTGLSLKVEDFFYSSRDGGIWGYQDMSEAIESELSNCDSFIFLVTPNFLTSKPCEDEYKIARVLKKVKDGLGVHVFLVPPLEYKDVKEEPIGSAPCSTLDYDDLLSLRDQLPSEGKFVESVDSVQFDKKLKEFLTFFKSFYSKHTISVDVNGSSASDLVATESQITDNAAVSSDSSISIVSVSGPSDQSTDTEIDFSVPKGLGNVEADIKNLEVQGANSKEASSDRCVPIVSGFGTDDLVARYRSDSPNDSEDEKMTGSAASVPPNSKESSLVSNNKTVKPSSEGRTTFECNEQRGLLSSSGSHGVKSYISSLESKARKRIPGSEFLLGIAYYDGILVERDLPRAFDLMKSAAQNRYTVAQLKLAEMYFWGETGAGVPNYELSVNWFEKVISNNNPLALHYIGFMYLYGLGCDPDLNKAEEYFERAQKFGYDDSHQFLDKIQQIRLRTGASLNYFVNEVYAHSDNIMAMLEAGKHYLEGGNGFNIDYGKSLEFFQMAADAGSAEAEREIGLMYYYKKTPFAVNFSDAIQHFKTAAERDDKLAEYYMGIMCRIGLGTEANQNDAKMWFDYAARQGHKFSQLELGKLYAQLDDPDYDAAIEMLQSATEQGSAEAKRQLGDLYHFGLACPKDPAEPSRLYQEAAEQEDDVAKIRLKDMQ